MNEVQLTVVQYIKDHPAETYKSVAEKIGVHPATVWQWAKKAGLPPRQNKTPDLSKLEG